MIKRKSIKGTIKRLFAFVLVILIILPTASFADDFILTDPVAATYTGRAQMASVINAARFADIADLGGAWPAEAVVRGVALGTIHPEGVYFRPHERTR